MHPSQPSQPDPSPAAVAVVIPARLASTRLPGKVLLPINDQPMLWHVWTRARQMRTPATVWIATDSAEIVSAVTNWGGRAIMTSPACRSGTERIASVLDQLDGDIIINVQGDEPLIDPALLDQLASAAQATGAALVTPVYRLTAPDDIHDPHVVKVVRAADGAALYFSRTPVPYVRDSDTRHWARSTPFWGHVGVYAFQRRTLAAYRTLPVGVLESAEKLEQLRFLEAGLRIQTVETIHHTVSVDTPDDLARVRRLMAETP